jgi:hypothetical protein
MKIKIQIEIDESVLEDVFVTAIEGGSNYWYFLSEDAVRLIRKAIPREEESCLSVATFKAVMRGVNIPINDVENEEDIIGWISLETMADRLTDLATSGNRWALDAHINEEGDADSADIVFQYLAMGDAVYG